MERDNWWMDMRRLLENNSGHTNQSLVQTIEGLLQQIVQLLPTGIAQWAKNEKYSAIIYLCMRSCTIT